MSADLLEVNYERWLEDPSSVDPSWSAFFEGFTLGAAQLRELGEVEGKGSGNPPEVVSAPGSPVAELTAEQLAFRGGVVSLVYNYRTLGHTQARINPLDKSPPRNPRLEPLMFGLNDSDIEREASTQFFRNGEKMQLREMVEALDETYSGWIGFEFMHIHNTEVRNWIRERIEGRVMHDEAPQELQEKTLGWLLEAELFESFLGKKFLGEKRFSKSEGFEQTLYCCFPKEYQ